MGLHHIDGVVAQFFTVPDDVHVGDTSLVVVFLVVHIRHIRLFQLGTLVGTNKSRLSHVINTGLGQNYASLVNRYRVKESIQLLSDEQYFLEKLEAIGEMCGYSNRQAFHAAFKKEMGITPNAWRRAQNWHPECRAGSCVWPHPWF